MTTAGSGDELWRLGATALASAVRDRHVSAREVVEAHLRRIDEVDAAVNAVVTRLDDRALEAAEVADRATVSGVPLPPLHGVPFTVKDNVDLAGTPTTQGARALADAYPTWDAPAVERLRRAGAIAIGKTNLPTYAMRWHTDSELWGETVNPWDRTLTPGRDPRTCPGGMNSAGFGGRRRASPAMLCPP